MVNKIIALITTIVTTIVSIFNFFFVPKCYEYRDLAYGTHAQHNLDLNIPKENDGEVGLILYIHGGAWHLGDKDHYDEEVDILSDYYGYVTASMNYRYVSEEVSIHDILDDITLALSCIKEKGAEHGVDINKVLLIGDSAGGHLSLLYGYSRVEEAPIKPAVVVSRSGGPVDFTVKDYYENCEQYIEPQMYILTSLCCGKSFTAETMEEARPYLEAISPINYIDENTVPTIINHGVNDRTVPYYNAEMLDAKLTEYGVPHILNPFPHSGHNINDEIISGYKGDKYFLEYCETYLN